MSLLASTVVSFLLGLYHQGLLVHRPSQDRPPHLKEHFFIAEVGGLIRGDLCTPYQIHLTINWTLCQAI